MLCPPSGMAAAYGMTLCVLAVPGREGATSVVPLSKTRTAASSEPRVTATWTTSPGSGGRPKAEDAGLKFSEAFLNTSKSPEPRRVPSAANSETVPFASASEEMLRIETSDSEAPVKSVVVEPVVRPVRIEVAGSR